MAKRRKRRASLGSSPATHRENFRVVLESLQKAVRHAEENARRGASCTIRLDNLVLAERRVENAADERKSMGSRHQAVNKDKGTTAFLAFNKRIGELDANFRRDCLKGY
jgi:hypothetical protein